MKLFIIFTLFLCVYIFSEQFTGVQQPEFEDDTQTVNMFKEVLEHLKPAKNKAACQIFPRELLVREKVGLRWDTVPEKYWEEEILPRLSGSVAVLDVGANTGHFALPMAKLGHTVISLEPNPNTCKTLKQNLETQGVSSKVCCLGETKARVFIPATY
jgi:predicted O-methyltransferase YrrM